MPTTNHRRLRARHVAVALLMAAVLPLVAVQPAGAATTRTATWNSSWRAPLASLNVTTNYGAYSLGCPNANRTLGYTHYLTSGRKQHLGLDLSAGAGSAVYAIGDGRVLNAGPLWGSEWGGVVLVEHFATNGERFTAVYGHIAIGKSPLTGAVWTPGDVVRRGQTLGTVVTTGTGAHLHFGIAPGAKTSVAGTSTSTTTGNCMNNPLGTVNPESYLSARNHSPLSGSIVGWRNANGSVTSWRVVTVDGKLRRYWIPNTTVYSCLRSNGVVDRGAMPSRFLNQLPDRTGYHATC